MRVRPVNLFLLRAALVFGLLLAAGAHAWAEPAGCAYADGAKSGAGIGGTGSAANGSGIGGTGIVQDSGAGKAELAGNVIFSQGAVVAERGGRTRPLAKGAQVCAGETIVTSQSGRAQIRMADGGMLALRPDTKIRIDAFHFDGKEDGTEKSAIALLQGGFRALTGSIGHTNKANYLISTPTATIGIRGTDHEPMYIPEPAPGQAAAVAPGTYDKVNSGGVVIRSPQGEVEVRPSQVGFVPIDPSAAPSILKEVPRFYRAETGAEEGRFGSRGGNDASRGEGGRVQSPEPHGGEMRAPDPGGSEPRMPEVRIPETQTPETHGPED